MFYRIIISALVILSSCTAAKVSVPAQFKGAATSMKVKGVNGWKINQKLSFGTYQTSPIKRGWDFASSYQFTKFNVKPEELLLKVFDIDTDKKNSRHRSRLQYTLEDGQLVNEIYATEQFEEKQLVYKSNHPLLGDVSKTKNYKYAFTAAIVPLNGPQKDPWSLVLVNRYDSEKDTARRLFDRPFVEEEGYVTNGVEKIDIRPLRLDKLTTKSGKQTKVFGGPLLSGYELVWDGGVVAIVDILDNTVWMYNDLEVSEKLLLSSVSSALLLRKLQDVEKDRDDLGF